MTQLRSVFGLSLKMFLLEVDHRLQKRRRDRTQEHGDRQPRT